MNTLPISHRAQTAPASPIRKLVPLADRAKKKGIKVYHLNIGQPDFALPDTIQRELKKISSLAYLPYANSQGLMPTIAAWQQYYKQIGIALMTDDISVTSGGSEALILAIAAVADPGDEVVVFEPFYANYAGFANLLAVAIVPVALDEASGYHLPDRKTIESVISKKTKAILITNPNNPTGTVFSKKEVMTILAIAKKHNLFIIADEAYRGISFDHNQCHSFVSVAKGSEKKRIITVDSLSKRLNVCGARVGSIICTNKFVMKSVNAYCQARLSAPAIEQMIVSSMLADSLKYISRLAIKYQKRRDAFLAALERELSVTIHYPQGAFYAMVKLSIDNSDDFAAWMLTDFVLDNKTVMVAPGSGFYATAGKGKDEIRVAYVLDEKDLIQAAHILAQGVKAYKTRKLQSS